MPAEDRPCQHPVVPPLGPLPQAVECPTLLCAAAVYGGFGLVTWFHAALPWWVLLPLGAYLLAWHGSLQHEVTHGHPTPSAVFNELLVLPSLWLWMPFRSEEHTSELQSLMRISYAVFCLKKKKKTKIINQSQVQTS